MMKVLERAVMTNGTKIQVEEWSDSYSFMPYGATVVTYPISKSTHKGEWSPKAGVEFRVDFSFDCYKDAKEAFDNLRNGSKTLVDYVKHMSDKKYADCI